jgi:hypothetical protein
MTNRIKSEPSGQAFQGLTEVARKIDLVFLAYRKAHQSLVDAI